MMKQNKIKKKSFVKIKYYNYLQIFASAKKLTDYMDTVCTFKKLKKLRMAKETQTLITSKQIACTE